MYRVVVAVHVQGGSGSTCTGWQYMYRVVVVVHVQGGSGSTCTGW